MKFEDLKVGVHFLNEHADHLGTVNAKSTNYLYYTWEKIDGAKPKTNHKVTNQDVMRYVEHWTLISPLMKELL
jgi:hypothetical protein